MSMKNSSDTIGNRTRDLPACSAVPQPTAPRFGTACLSHLQVSSSVRMRDAYVVCMSQDVDACTGEEPTGEYVCKAEQCRQAASRILASMNWRTDPCRDFYKFACGGWAPGMGVGRRNASSRYGQNPELSFNTLQKHVDQQIQCKFCSLSVLYKDSVRTGP
jgi:hypothetical protein